MATQQTYDMNIKISCIFNQNLDDLERFGEHLTEIIDHIISTIPETTIESYERTSYDIQDHEVE